MMKTALLLIAAAICCEIMRQTLKERSFEEVVTMIVFDNQDNSAPVSCEKGGARLRIMSSIISLFYTQV